MKVTYDQEVDILRIILNDEDIDESDEDKPGIIIDYDDQGNIVGMEILDASTRVTRTRGLWNILSRVRRLSWKRLKFGQ